MYVADCRLVLVSRALAMLRMLRTMDPHLLQAFAMVQRGSTKEEAYHACRQPASWGNYTRQLKAWREFWQMRRSSRQQGRQRRLPRWGAVV